MSGCGSTYAQPRETDITQSQSGSVYVGLDAGLPLATGTFSSLGHRFPGFGISAGALGGYRFSHLLSVELSACYGRSLMSARNCCAASYFWLGEDIVQYPAPVAGINGSDYTDLESSVALQQYGFRLNINILQLLHQFRSNLWGFEITPALSAVGSKSALKSHSSRSIIKRFNTDWHLGYGLGLHVNRKLSKGTLLGAYTEITWLTGPSVDAIPSAIHHSNLIWQTGLRLSWTILKLPSNN